MIGFLVIELRIARPVQIATSYFDKRRCDGTILLLMLFPTSQYSGLVLLVAIVAPAAEPQQAPLPRAVPIAGLVQQLGSDDFREREAASKRLGAMTLDPPPELLAATRSDIPEIRERAAKAAQAMRANIVPTRLPRGQRFAEQGRVDLFVAATAAWDLKSDDERLWSSAIDLGKRLIAKAGMTGDRTPHGCHSAYKDPKSVMDRRHELYTRVDTVYERKDLENKLDSFYNEAIQAPGFAASKGIVNHLIVSRGVVTVAKGIETCDLLANGDISAKTIMRNSVLVCDGDVTLSGGHFFGCLVVARGNIAATDGAEMSVLMAGGKVTLGKVRVTKKQEESGHYNVVVEGEPNTLGLTFFELLDTLGLVVKVVDGNVIVANYKVHSTIAKAGVKIGDIITAVNGKKPDSAESLRRLLRDALAIGDATVTLRRDEKTETVKVSLPE
jgi:PDZ domain